MNKQQATDYMENLLQSVWHTPNPDKVAEFYDQNIDATISGHKVSYSDIVKHSVTTKKYYQQMNNTIEEIIASEDKIVVRIKQSAKPCEANKPNDSCAGQQPFAPHQILGCTTRHQTWYKNPNCADSPAEDTSGYTPSIMYWPSASRPKIPIDIV